MRFAQLKIGDRFAYAAVDGEYGLFQKASNITAVELKDYCDGLDVTDNELLFGPEWHCFKLAQEESL